MVQKAFSTSSWFWVGLKHIELSRLSTNQWEWLTPDELATHHDPRVFLFPGGQVPCHSLIFGESHCSLKGSFSAWPQHVTTCLCCHSTFLPLTLAVTARQWQQIAVNLPGNRGLDQFLFCPCVQQLWLPVWPYVFIHKHTHTHTHTHTPKLKSIFSAWLEEAFVSNWAFLMAQMVKNLPAMQEMWVQSLSWENPLEKRMATHSSILAWRISRTEETGQLLSTGSQSCTQLSD